MKASEGAVNGHVTIEAADGEAISGSITNGSIEALGLKEGGRAVAIGKPIAEWSPSTNGKPAYTRHSRAGAVSAGPFSVCRACTHL